MGLFGSSELWYGYGGNDYGWGRSRRTMRSRDFAPQPVWRSRGQRHDGSVGFFFGLMRGVCACACVCV